ncbi:phospholipid-translocating P-type ATPase [Russula brevipes]|nr:phospholipid-translocating P-type ATPase [Russula brevipes]
MSDIRLHTLRTYRNRNGHAARLDSSDSAQHQRPNEPTSATGILASGSRTGSPMPLRAPLNTTAAAAASSSSSSFSSARRKKGRRRDDYGEGAPEEEATLLGEGERDPGFLHDEDDRPASAKRAHDAASQRSTLRRGSKDKSRTVPLRPPEKLQSRFPPNIVRNQKYNVFTFLPIVFYEQFKFFFNLYFLLVALSQFVPALRTGFLVTYIAPLAFVLLVTMGKEAYDDYKRNLRDREANSARYLVLASHSSPSRSDDDELSHSLLESNLPPTRAVPSSSIRVGDLVLLEKNQRVPADLVLLRTSDSSGTCFIRTDQLDGETDWKLRVAVPATQKLPSDQELFNLDADIYADAPTKDIHAFIGTFTINTPPGVSSNEVPMVQVPTVEPLSAENVLWANTVLAAGSAIGFVVYTGPETRAVMNTSHPQTKVGLLDLEISQLAKILCAVSFVLSVALVALNGFRGLWYIYVFRFLILFSSIIPISLRVNLDMGKTVYAHLIMKDNEIPGTIVRTSTLPEELGRIEYLLSDKTGTLTQNEMEMKKLHLGTMSFGHDAMDEVVHQLGTAFGADGTTHARHGSLSTGVQLATRGRRDMSARVRDVVLSLALCHNVTPVTNDDGSVAIVKWTESVGVTLTFRDRTRMELRTPSGSTLAYDVLEIFPFTSESKRMGIVVRDTASGELTFLQKGADVVMARIVQRNDWLEEESANMAREGLRTLVVARRKLSEAAYGDFKARHHAASVRVEGRNEAMAAVVADTLERDLELLGLTGVEDKLQDDVRGTLELLRNAGIKIGCSPGTRLRRPRVRPFPPFSSRFKTAEEAQQELDFLQNKLDCCLVIDGESLQLCLNLFKNEFIEISTKLSAVVACRCSPTQKADVARLIRSFTKKRVCCIGDGGNDVSMIQAADVGVGIVGKEGKQASLAADFSVTQFSYLTKLLLWHGRNSYRRSAKLAQFVIHRGLIISVMQAVFSSIFYFAPIALYQGWLMVGYATIYTMAPVFSLVLDRDLNEGLALSYPELYKELTKGRALSYKTFFIWLMISVYQGAAIMIIALVLFENEFLNIVAISFTALILNELIMVALEITIWHVYMIISEVVTLGIYAFSMVFLPEYFVAVIVAVSALPLWIIKLATTKL